MRIEEAPSPVQRSRRYTLWIIAGAWAGGIAIGLLAVGLRKGGFLDVSDVGQLDAMSEVQAQLQPIDACGIDYATRDKHGRRTHLDVVFVRSCSGLLEAGSVSVVSVPETWGRRAVGFEMRRGKPSDRWKILVEKGEVPFDDLRAALTDFTPRILAQLPAELARHKAWDEQWKRDQAERERAEQARKANAARSYPTK